MKAILVLEDGFNLSGYSFTGECESGGEVIFNTSMSGYQEILTDPSYAGQMVCMTYPLIGNYGINPYDMESAKVHAQALLVKECCKIPSNWKSTQSLPDFLKAQGVPGLEGLDTRALTRHLRVHGAMRGVISTSVFDVAELSKKAQAMPSMQGQNLVQQVAAKKPSIWTGTHVQEVQLGSQGEHVWKNAELRLIVYDFGIKWNILRILAAEGFDILLVPPNFSLAEVKNSGAQAIFLSNGPGDPATLKNEVEIIRAVSQELPTAGICLGHQLLALAYGASTIKLKFGHHGCNNPVKNLATGHIEISSQNHGFCVVLNDLSELEITHINLNDQTLEGFAHKKLPVIALQHHPEASSGPNDSQYFFARFKKMVQKAVAC